tara:strand:+ start:1443 stop:2405 length:963 start_codon:yes stop_codon:yes gene_type:complete
MISLNSNETEIFVEEFIIHPGYPKTGTTFYQDIIFNNLDHINYIGKTSVQDNEFIDNINILRDYLCNNLSENLDIENKLINFFKKRVNKKKIHLLSSEFFFDVEHNKLGNDFKKFVSIESVCKRIFKFFSKFSRNVKIIISIREPNELLHRYYLNRYEHYKKFNIYDFESFKKFQFKSEESFASSLKFEKLYKLFKENFNKDIFFIKFELLSKKSEFEIKKISKIFGVNDAKIIKLITENKEQNKSLKINNKYYATYNTYPNWIYKIKKKFVNFRFFFLLKIIFNFFFSFLKKKDLIRNEDDDNPFFKETKLFYIENKFN